MYVASKKVRTKIGISKLPFQTCIFVGQTMYQVRMKISFKLIGVDVLASINGQRVSTVLCELS